MVAAVLHLDIGAGAIGRGFRQIGRGLFQALDVIDPHPFRRQGLRAIGAGRAFQAIAQHRIDLVHGGEGVRIDLGGAAGDDHSGARSFAAQAANSLARLPHRFGGDGAGVEDHRVRQTIGAGAGQGLIALIGVQAAPEGDHRQPVLGGGALHQFRRFGGAHGRTPS